MKPKIGLSQKELKGVVEMLSVVLANAVVVYNKTRKFN